MMRAMHEFRRKKQREAHERRAAREALPRAGRMLMSDHERLERMFDDLAAAIRSDDRDAMRIAWTGFEYAVRAHLAFEEIEILPLLERSQPGVVARVRSEHAGIRRSLDELGVALELHAIRAHMTDDLIRELRAHARWEETSFYPFAALERHPAAQRERERGVIDSTAE